MTENIRCAAGFSKTSGSTHFGTAVTATVKTTHFCCDDLYHAQFSWLIRIAEPNGALLNFTSFWKKGQFWSDANSASADQFWGTRFLSVSPFPRELSHYTANSTGYQKNAGVNFPTLLIQKQQKEKWILQGVAGKFSVTLSSIFPWFKLDQLLDLCFLKLEHLLGWQNTQDIQF